MRFVSAWSSVLTQNLTLKVVIICLSFVILILGFTSVAQSFRSPLVIERSCKTEVKKLASEQHSEKEIKAFITWALAQRFNSQEQLTLSGLSFKEQKKRKAEFKEIKYRKIKQVVLVNNIDISPKHILVDTDRLISVDKIRSAFMFPLIVKLESTNRTKDNPYGLILKTVNEYKQEGKKK